jgi:hypothetical protein
MAITARCRLLLIVPKGRRIENMAGAVCESGPMKQQGCDLVYGVLRCGGSIVTCHVYFIVYINVRYEEVSNIC